MNPKFEELKLSGDLPSPCGVGMTILKLTQDEDFSTDDLVETIQTDPALTGQLLKMANGARSAGVEASTTIEQATMRLGANAVRNVALGFSLMSGNRTGKCEAFDYEQYWARSLFAGVAAQTLGADTPRVAPAEAFVCGLLSGVGSLALASAHPRRYAEIIREFHARPNSQLAHEERRSFEITHDEVSQAMLLEWGLPDRVADAVATHGERPPDDVEVDDLRTVLWAAAVLSRLYVATDEERHQALAEVDLVKNALGLADERFFERCNRIVEDWRDMAAVMAVEAKSEGAFRDAYVRAGEYSPDATDEATAPSPPTPSDSPAEPIVVGDAEHGPVDVRPEEGESFASWDSARILAIEDNNLSLRVLVRELEKVGHEVKTASDGQSGMRMALEWNPQIVITDWMMPEMDGIELCRALRRFETGREMYLIILTGNEEEDQIVEAFNAGIDDYVLKPFRPRLLAARVRAGMRVVKLQERIAADRRKMQDQVAELGVLTRRLEQATLTDPLTGLPNRRFAMQNLEHEWERATSSGQPLSVIMADIDHFKQVNDEYGHDAGDHVLKEVGRVLATTLRGSEPVCRWGGEEFLVICGGADLQAGLGCAERLRAAIENNVVLWGGLDRALTLSMGVAELRPGMGTSFDLVKEADLGAYQAKEEGRNCVRSVQNAHVPSA